MLKSGNTYEEVISNFRWEIPEYYNIGVDICDTLSKHFGKSIPLFIDNAESITEIPETDAQQIRLVVSENDKKLRIA